MSAKTLTFGSLFAGIPVGGFDLGFERAGLRTRWMVEIDPHARRVLAYHWPSVTLADDVRQWPVGRRSKRVDVICFGSPCQDLSVAGKRAGMVGERSGLFFEAIRIVRELRPTFAVFENVPGIFSSHGGRDFLAILRAFHECGARDIAWRVLDAQHWGVAQRRRRVFVVADFAGERAGQILFESEGCRRHPAPRGEAQPDVAGTIGSCPSGRGWNGDLDRAGAFVPGLAGTRRASEARNPHREGVNENLIANAVTPGQHRASGNRAGENLVASTLRSRQSNPGVSAPGRGGEDDQNLVYQCHGSNVGPMGALRAGNGNETGGVPFVAVSAFGGNRTSGPIDVATAVNACKTASGRQDFETETFIIRTDQTGSNGNNVSQGVTPSLDQGAPPAVAFNIVSTAMEGKNHAYETNVSGCPQHKGLNPTGNEAGTVIAHTLRAGGHDAGEDGTGRGTPLVVGSTELNDDGTADYLTDYPDVPGAIAGQSVRRLTPVECCRLQGFSDDWLDLEPSLSDSAKYRLLGNAVAVPVAEWIGRRIVATLETESPTCPHT